MMRSSVAIQAKDEQEICEAIADAAADERQLEIAGGGTKQGIGNPERETLLLSTASLTRVIDYDPAELVLTVEPGVRLAKIETVLAEQNQMLAFDPWDFAETTGGEVGHSTLGGVVAAGLAGPRRLTAGGIRDHVLGFSAVNGRGEAFKAGGRVVKNVTGYDLPKLMAGSWGQLAVMTQLTLKVMPQPEVVKTIAVRGLSPVAAVNAMGLCMRSPAGVAAAAWVGAAGGDPSLTALRLEGFGPSVEARLRMVEQLLVDSGRADVIDAGEADVFWRRVRCGALTTAQGLALWRIIVPPARGADVVEGVERFNGAAMIDWAGGLVWAQVPIQISAARLRSMAEQAGGHAIMISAPRHVRATTSALHPEAAGVALLSRKVREAFDPAGVLDPLRFSVR